MYPTNADGSSNPCYDIGRPSWLPYYIDDFTESNCFYPEATLAGQMGGVVGHVAGLAVDGAAQGIEGSFQNLVPTLDNNTIVMIGIGILAFMLFREK